MVDIARTLTAERGDSADAEVARLGGGRARGHRESRRDLDMALPWARLVFGKRVAHGARPRSRRWVGRRSRLLFSHSRPWPTRRTAARPPYTNSPLSARAWLPRAPPQSDALARIDALIESLARSAAASGALVRRLSTLVQLTQTMFDAMEFGFLFDPTRKLFSIGYRVTDNSLDPSCYDLLASEARLTSFIAIAKGDVPSSHWFHLGRALTPVDRGSALVSWSGSMFEYLMPALVMRSPAGSLLDQTCHLIVRRQSNMEPSVACRGGSQNRPTTRAIWS